MPSVIAKLAGAARSLYVNMIAKIDELIDRANMDVSYQAVVIPVVVSADASGGQNVTIPFAMKITGFDVIGTATAAASTLQLRSGTNAISSAVACAAADAKASTTQVVQAYAAVADGAVLNVIAASGTPADARGISYVKGYRT